MELEAIPITRAELQERLAELKDGMTPQEVSGVLGGAEFKTEIPNSFWRFRVVDAENPDNPYEIYMGTFKDGKLTFGSILPRG